jgi:hypothetical protein
VEREQHPIRLVVTDDLRRSRLTVFFRLLLSLPHLVWLSLWTVVVLVAAFVAWIAALVVGRLPDPFHRFLSAYVRYGTHVAAYLFLAGNPFPGFVGRAGSYPVDLEVAEPAPQSRWSIFFRPIIGIPALLLAGAFSGSTSSGGGGGTIGTSAFLGWFAALVRGRLPEGLRGLLAYSIRYVAQTYGYLFLLTSRYPDADPSEPALERPLDHPVRLVAEGDLRRSRLTVLFRLLLYLPHAVWLVLWGIAVFFAAIANWFVALVRGRPAASLHRFIAAYVRYATHVSAFLYLVANPFPGFTGRPGSYPVELVIGEPERQSRWVTGFRLLLALPAFFLLSALNAAFGISAILAWFHSLVLGRTRPGLRGLGAYALRYSGQVYSYLLLLTARYPHSAPPA